ncbi:MAG: hypothetical protein A3F11_05205 [Gammaproteobacteria bacterium RIFCSPHIGHO2_12_FULL_37_14]|nr:MAG: hypothetical protein A3F11_05205 [Gammaproteobacteria bacterium RIFCSPHIGHO2_12_FULL_37_14]
MMNLSEVNNLQHLSRISWQQKLFKLTPKLVAVVKEDTNVILKLFLQAMEEKKRLLNWMTHIHLLHWLSEHKTWRASLNQDTIKELMTATVIRWSLVGLEHIDTKGIVVSSLHLPDIAVGLWKSKKIGELNKLVSIQLPQDYQPQQDSYALAYQHYWQGLIWNSFDECDTHL